MKKVLIVCLMLVSLNLQALSPVVTVLAGGRLVTSFSYDADAQAFFNAVVANGGTISTATKGYVNTFVLAAKANGYWSKLNRINLFCGDQLLAAVVPLKIGGGNTTDTNHNFVNGDYTEATGLTGDGSTKYLETGLNPSVSLTANSTHISVYNRSSTGSGHIGSESGSNNFEMWAPLGGGTVYSDQYNATGGQGRVNTSGSVATPWGFLVGSRISSSDHQIYRNGSSVATSATSGGSIPSQAIFIFATSNNGSPGDYSGNSYGSYSFGDGLTSTDVTNYYNDLQAFQTSLARNI